MSENSAASPCAFAAVRFAITTSRSSLSSSGASTPRTAPPAPRMSTRLSARRSFILRSRSAVSPSPSVLSPSSVVSSKKAIVLTACARWARGVSSFTSSAAACLWRQGNVEAAYAAGEQLEDVAAEVGWCNVEQPVDKILRRRLGEHAVDEGRPAVRDGMAGDAILIGFAGFSR